MLPWQPDFQSNQPQQIIMQPFFQSDDAVHEIWPTYLRDILLRKSGRMAGTDDGRWTLIAILIPHTSLRSGELKR